MSCSRPALNASPALAPRRRATTDAPAAVPMAWSQKPAGSGWPWSPNSPKAALAATARTVAKPRIVTDRHAEPIWRDRP